MADELKSRLQRIQGLCGELGLDALMISDPDNRFYVTGYSAHDHGITESAGVALVSPDAALLVTSTNNTAWAADEATAFEVIGWSRPWEKFVGELIAERKWQRVGFEPASISVGTWQAISEHGKGFSFEPMNGQIDVMRWVKSDDEIALIQKAINITDAVFEEVEPQIVAGMTERQVARLIEDGFRDHGADGPGFSTAVAAGPNGARPHHATGETLITEGIPIVIDMGAVLDGYNADLTRTTWIGEPDAQVAAIYDLVAESHRVAIAAVSAGVPAKDVDLASRKVFEDAGYADNIIHGVGHGLGIRVHDGPSVSKLSDRPLDAGNVITIEPGLYFPGSFGVRIEDVVVVEENGCRVMSHARKKRITN
ncbi:MAG: aminopeptidase P family protein [Thermomicrobiales bacterium]|jgi:Xaa-Pro aminopeptidase|nr:aminopeptidase P family protein [Thermomicrobiales bacterium]